MNVESIRAMAGNNPNRALIDSLSGENSYFLTQQVYSFNRLLDDTAPKISIVYLYETVMSPTAQKVGSLRGFYSIQQRFLLIITQTQEGQWTMDGPKRLLVPVLSASPGREGEFSRPVERTHSGMVKFGLQDDELLKVSGYLQHLVAGVLQQQNG